jgi:hypothetical protein
MNGTYEFVVDVPEGYTATPSSGALTVNGSLAVYSIEFHPVPTLFGLPAIEGYGILGGVLIAVLAVTAAVVLLRRRGRTTPPGPARPQADPGPGEPPSSR